MYRRSDEDFAKFRVALRNTDQEHVVWHYLENFSMTVQESGSEEETMPKPTENLCEPAMDRVTERVNDQMEFEQSTEGASSQQQDQCQYG